MCHINQEWAIVELHDYVLSTNRAVGKDWDSYSCCRKNSEIPHHYFGTFSDYVVALGSVYMAVGDPR